MKVAPRISPTNLGFLLNARQVACEFGYLTVPELAEQTLRTLATVSKLQLYRGHLMNWYDTRSLAPLLPAIVSSVDNGNFVASLWTLQQGCLQLLEQPLLQPQLPEGILDHLYISASLGVLPRKKFSAVEKGLRGEDWLYYLQALSEEELHDLNPIATKTKHAEETRWFQEEAQQRFQQVRRTIQLYTPWLLPEFAPLKDDPALRAQGSRSHLPALEFLPAFIDSLTLQLADGADSGHARQITVFFTGSCSRYCPTLVRAPRLW